MPIDAHLTNNVLVRFHQKYQSQTQKSQSELTRHRQDTPYLYINRGLDVANHEILS